MSRWLLAPLVLLTACSSAANPYRLEEQAALFHDDLRWGRMPSAEQQVARAMRARFVRGHASWGRRVTIVDLELEGARISGLTGTVRARYVWTRTNDVDVRETFVETHWLARVDGSWICDAERVVGGDAALLAER